MRKLLVNFILISLLMSCSNTPELETGEIKTLQLLKNTIDQTKKPNVFIDSRLILSREQIDAASTPVLFVRLESGQNGTLTPYPGRGVGQTWLGADGATITLDRGVLKASRGMGDDLMGSTNFMPSWSEIHKGEKTYKREVKYLSGNNTIYSHSLNCSIKKSDQREKLEIWKIFFYVNKFEESCSDGSFTFKNTYQVDTQGIVRRSTQYHSKTIGSILIERLDL